MYNDGIITTEFTGSVVSGTYVYPSAEQNAVIKFNDFYLSGRDGDFTTNGIAVQYMTGESEDITIGNAPSAVITANMMNPDGAMDSLTWGYGTAYIGVVTASAQADTYSTWPCYININSTRYGITNNRMYKGTSYSALTGEPVAVIVASDGTATYITDTQIGYHNGSSFSTITTPSAAQAFLAAKCRRYNSPVGIGLDANGCPAIFNDVSGDTKKTYTYVPMGVFDFSGVDAYGITFNAEAYDKMTLFDADATDWVQNLDFTTPKALSTLIGELMTEMGLSCNIPASAVNTSVTLSENPITSYSVTYRQILKWLSEAIGCNVRMSRTGTVEFVTYSATPVGNAITPDTIVSNGRTKNRYTVPGINQVICYNAVGAGYEYHDSALPPGTDMVPLYIVANPFVDPSASMTTIQNICGLVDDIPAYYPTTLNVVCSDPRIDAGDFVTVYNTDNTTTYNVPVMSQTIYWSNACRTQYIATGNQTRQIPDAITDCSDLSGVVSSNPAAVVNMIQAHGIDADWITAGTISDRNGNNTWNLDTGNFTLTTGKIETTYTHTYEYTDYDASDITRITQIMSGQITPTEADYDKYDTDGNGYIRLLDRVRIQAMIDNHENLTKTITTTIDPSANNKAIAIRVQIPAIGQAAAVDRYATYAVSQVNVNTGTFFDLFASTVTTDTAVHHDETDDTYININGNYIEFLDEYAIPHVMMTRSSLDYDDGSNNHTVITPTGITYRDGVASPTERILRRTRSSSGTSTVTLETGIYIAYVTHTNSSTATETGMYIIQAGSTSSIREVVAAGNQTLSVSGLTLTWTTSNSNRQLRLVYIS